MKVCAVAAVAMLAGSAYGAVILSEDFEGAWPPAGWSVVDNAGTGVAWNTATFWGASNYTNGSGEAAMVDSDAFGTAEFDTELWTPVLDLTGAPSGDLTFTANYQNFANEDFFDVDYSTDGGATWTNLMSWNEDHGGFRAPPGEDVSLTIPGGGMTIVRFYYYDPATSDWEWYIQIDDVLVDAIPAPSTLALLGLGGLAIRRRR